MSATVAFLLRFAFLFCSLFSLRGSDALRLGLKGTAATDHRKVLTQEKLRGSNNHVAIDVPPKMSTTTISTMLTSSTTGTTTSRATSDTHADVAWCKGGSLLCKLSHGVCIIDAELGEEICSCKEGWTGPSCMDDLDECQELDPKPCSFPGGYCVDRDPDDGMYACGCDTRDGHWRNGTVFDDHGVTSCVDVVECDEWMDRNLCGTDAVCTNLEGTYACSCPLDLVGDPSVSCELPTEAPLPVEEALGEGCTSNEDCQDANTFCDTGSIVPVCRCSPGYFQGSLGLKCQVEDGECNDPRRNNCHRNAICVDQAVGYSCRCGLGYTDAFDGAAGTDCRQIDECTEGDHDCDLTTSACIDRTPPLMFECVKKTPAPTPTPTNRPTSPIPINIVPATIPHYVCSIAADCSVESNPAKFSGDCKDLSTPQGEAYEWMVQNEFKGSTDCSAPRINQRYALFVFYFFRTVAPSSQALQWLDDKDPYNECEWDEVICAEEKIIHFNILRMGSIGTMPPELGNLVDLLSITMYANSFSGIIPTELGLLSKLTGLTLDSNGLTGPLPSELGELTALETLSASLNALTGTIPLEFGNLSSIQNLYLADNKLSGPLSSVVLSRLGNLQRLSLKNNILTGTIPSMLEDLTELKELRLNENLLTGTIPPELGELTKVEQLALNTNMLSGSIPTELAKMTDLKRVNLSDNPELSGVMPTEVCELRCSYLENLSAPSAVCTNAMGSSCNKSCCT